MPSGPRSSHPCDGVPKRPGSGDGKICTDRGQIGRLCETGGFSTLNNGQRQFVAKPLAPHISRLEPVSGRAENDGGMKG